MAATNGRELLSIERVSVFYDQFRAVQEVDLTVSVGEVVSIIGANGAGKSSLLKAIIGRADRVDGAIRYDGKDLAGRSTAGSRQRHLARAGRAAPVSDPTVEENLLLGWRSVARARFASDDIYGYFPIQAATAPAGAGLSGGEQQMVALGRALLANRACCSATVSLGLAPIVVNDLYAILRPSGRGDRHALVEQDITRSLAVADASTHAGRVCLSRAAGRVTTTSS